jgi:hypothetical protein
MIDGQQKIFGIGFHKTGTTSLALALKILGYRTNRGLDELRNTWGLKRCVKLLEEKDYELYLDFIKDYDATLDNPWYLLFRELDERFPNSKFILTYRNPEQWIKSCSHYFEGTKNILHQYIYGNMEIKGNEDLYLKRYVQHIEAVKTYFKNRPNDLLISNWEGGDGWTELCSFLNVPIIQLPFPHLNKKGDEIFIK